MKKDIVKNNITFFIMQLKTQACIFFALITILNSSTLEIIAQENKLQSINETLLDINISDIDSILIEKGSSGCFHYEIAKDTYINRGSCFLKKNKDKISDNEKSLKLKKTIPNKQIQLLIDEIKQTQVSSFSLKDLNITAKDISKYKDTMLKKRKILLEEEKEFQRDLDEFNATNDNEFIHLVSNIPPEGPINEFWFVYDSETAKQYFLLADSITYLSDKQVNQILRQHQGYISTSRDWIQIIIYPKSKKNIFLYNDNYYTNFIYSPWVLEQDESQEEILSPNIGLLFNEITNEKIIPQKMIDKQCVIHSIVTCLYSDLLNHNTP